jgi:hypothetical protein
MKKILPIIVFLITNQCFGQAYVANAYEAKSYFKLNGYKVVGISNDSLEANKRFNYLWTESAGKKFVISYVATHGGSGGGPAFDSTYVYAAILNCLKYSDTSTMLGVYRTALNGKLSIAAAAATYQPIGSYLTGSALTPYLTTAIAASTYQPIGSYLTSINSSQVITALGYTPYDASNPTGYLTTSSISGKLNISDTAAMLNLYKTVLATNTANIVLKANTNNPSFTGLVSAGGATADSAITTTSLHVTTNMRVDGNVGVGPVGAYPLSVVGTGATSILGYFEQPGSLVPTLQTYMKNTSSNVSTNAVVGALGFGNYFNSSYSPTTQNIADIQGVYLGSGTTQRGGINLRTHNGTTLATRLNINDTGIVKIPYYGAGTTLATPAYGLGVRADGTIIEIATGGGSSDSSTFSTNFRRDSLAINLRAEIAAIAGGGTGWGKIGNTVTAGSQFLGSTNNVSLRIRANNTERLVIDSVGTSTFTGPSLTGSAAQAAVVINQTWNTSASVSAFIVNATNTASGGSASVADFRIGGNSVAIINKVGAVYLAQANGASFGWSGRSRIWCNADGIINLSNNAQDNITRVNWGSTTSAYPSIARNAATLEFKLADNSAFAGTQSLYDRFGAGSPEGGVTAPVGAVYHRTDGGAGTSFYVKESGTGNTGWIAK